MSSDPFPGVFAFETYMERTLEYMPVSVRMRLELCGCKLTLAQWCGLPLAARRTILDLGCETPGEILRTRRYLESTIAAFELGPLARLQCDPQGWSARSRVPAIVVTALSALGLPRLDQGTWSGLGDVQRFALLELAREGRERKLRAAVEEFDLHRDGEPDDRFATSNGDAGPETQVFAFLAHGLRAGPYREFSRPVDRDAAGA
jgi:hypothetical protein